MKTLLLDTVSWDLLVDSYGSIAVASNPYALAQDAASAIKLFQGEQYYNTFNGVPYWATILGKSPPLSLMKSYFTDAAMTVPEVTAARCFLTSFINRKISGQVQVTDSSGQTTAAAF